MAQRSTTPPSRRRGGGSRQHDGRADDGPGPWPGAAQEPSKSFGWSTRSATVVIGYPSTRRNAPPHSRLPDVPEGRHHALTLCRCPLELVEAPFDGEDRR